MAEGGSNYDVILESLSAVKFIAVKAQDVYINQIGIKNLASRVMEFLRHNVQDNFHIVTNRYRRHASYPNKEDSRAVDWLFVLHTLNFSLWNRKGTRQWTVDGTEGFLGLCIAIKRAIDEEKPIWDPRYYTRMTQSEFEHIFRSDDGKTSIPLISERLRILHEVGEVLLDKYEGTFVECIKSSEYDADKLVKLLFDEFESYRDEAVFEGLKVRFHTKAKSLVSDIWMNSKKHKPIFKLDTTKMMSTMFIDYRALQVLLHFKALRFSDMLETRFANNNEPLEHGSREELEIRGCSLFAALKVCEEVQKMSRHYIEKMPVLKTAFNVSILVDNYLSGILAYSHEYLMEKQPFHYIRTIYY